jgi:hypothetical protein
VRRHALALAFLASTLIATGCSGGTQDETGRPAEAISEGVDSTQRFQGQRRAIAGVIEDYEAAVRAGDAAALCRRVVRLDRKRVSHAEIARCIGDPNNDAIADAAEARAALDLVVRRIVLVPRRPRDVAGVPASVPRYEIEWDLEATPRAVALVESADPDADAATGFGLSRYGDRWRIISRWRAHRTEPPEGRRARVEFFRRQGVLGLYGVGRTGPPRCRGVEGGISHGILAPPRASSVREAVMRSDIGPRLRRALQDGATLSVSTADYSDLTRTFTLRAPSGRPVVSFPVYGPGPRYITADIWGCRRWLERLTRIDLRGG